MQQIKRGKPGPLGLIRIQQSSLPIPSTLWARCHPVPPSATGDVEGPGGHRPWQLAGAAGDQLNSPSYAQLKSYVLSFQQLRMFSFCFWMTKIGVKRFQGLFSQTAFWRETLSHVFLLLGEEAAAWSKRTRNQIMQKLVTPGILAVNHSTYLSLEAQTLHHFSWAWTLSCGAERGVSLEFFPGPMSKLQTMLALRKHRPQHLQHLPMDDVYTQPPPKTLNPSVTQGTPATTKNLRRLGSNCGTMMFQIRKLQKKSSVD